MLKRAYLEITNACNLNCPFCTNEKGNSFLSYEEIDLYTTQIKEFTDYIYLHILGEPLLHKDFERILDLLDSKDLKLQLVTNGTLLYRYPDILKHKCLRKLSISLHSINNTEIDNSYFKTIDRLIENNTDTKLELRFYGKDNLDNSLSDYLNKLRNKYGLKETVKSNSYEIKRNTYIYFSELFKWPDINDETISHCGTCHGAIDMIAINSNSDVTICCLDPKAHNCIGNLKKDTLKDILESDKYKAYVNAFKENRIISKLCSKCSYRLRFDGKNRK